MQKTEEKNEDTIALETKFNSSWTLWESLKMISPTEEYSSLMNEVFRFSTVKEMIETFGLLPHGTPSRVFFDKEQGRTKKFKIPEKEFRAIDTILLFREDIHPSWEDPRNKYGGIYYYTFNEIDLKVLDDLWINLVTGLVGETLRYSEGINGIRLCDKSKPPRSQTVRLEIWMRDDLTMETITNHNSMKDELTNLVKEITKITKNVEPTYKSNESK